MSLKSRIKQLERASKGRVIPIPLEGGGVARFAERELADAYLVALDRTLGRTTEDHPLCQAARNSSDPKWREGVFSGPEEVPEPPEDLSE